MTPPKGTTLRIKNDLIFLQPGQLVTVIDRPEDWADLGVDSERVAVSHDLESVVGPAALLPQDYEVVA